MHFPGMQKNVGLTPSLLYIEFRSFDIHLDISRIHFKVHSIDPCHIKKGFSLQFYRPESPLFPSTIPNDLRIGIEQNLTSIRQFNIPGLPVLGMKNKILRNLLRPKKPNTS